MAAADHQDDLNKLIQCRGDMTMTSHRISHLAAALAGVLTMSGIATQVLAQEIRGDQLDESTVHRRAIEAVVWGMPAVNAQLMFDAAKNCGSDYNQVVFWSRPVTWKNQTLTPNPSTIYVFPIYNTKDAGPMVLEIPPADKENSITGSVDDGWQTAIEDVGPAGVDKGKGGKYLILPPGYIEKVPDGYIPLPSNTFSGFALLRSNLKSGSDADIAQAVAYGKRVKFYPLSQASNPPETKFVDAIDIVFDSTIPYDLRFLETLDRFMQREPWLDRDRVMIDFLKTIGIEKGKPFNPDEKTRQVLKRCRARGARLAESEVRKHVHAAVLQGRTLGDGGVEGGDRRVGDRLRQSQRLSRRRPRRHLLLRVLQPQAPGRGAVLPDGDREQGQQIVRRRPHLSPERAGECSGQVVLVGDGVRPRDPRANPRDALVEPRLEHAGADEERRRVDGPLLRPQGAGGEGIELGAHQERWRVRGAVPVLRPRKAAVR
jgi:Protein of unknown function (DUF1254)